MTYYKNFVLRGLFLALALIVFVAFLGGCASSGRKVGALRQWMEDSSKMRVLCTTAQVADLVQAVGGDRIKIWVLIQGDLDPHSYELVKGDDEKFFRADIIFFSGLNLEHGASLHSLLKKSAVAVSVGDSIADRYPSLILKKDSIVDPHLWMDVSLWQKGLDPIAESLAKIDSEGAGFYQKNARDYSDKMSSFHEVIQGQLRSIDSSRRFLMTSHDAFRYFTRAYLAEDQEDNWIQRFAAPEGLAPDGQLSCVDIQNMIDFVAKHRVCVIFPESNVSRDSVRKIASAGSDLGMSVRVCTEPLYGDSMGGHSYFEMMQSNADVLTRNMR